VRTRAELERYARSAGTREGLAAWFAEELAGGAIARVLAAIHADDSRLAALLILLADPETPLAARVGIGAIMEDFTAQPALKRMVPQLGALTRHTDARVRTDAAHYLALSGAPEAIEFLESLRKDTDANVREVAQESLNQLNSKA
jgi:HEAT repeat protein